MAEQDTWCPPQMPAHRCTFVHTQVHVHTFLVKGLDMAVPGEAYLAWDNHPNLTSNSYLLGLPGASSLLQPRYGPGTRVGSGYLTAHTSGWRYAGGARSGESRRPWVLPDGCGYEGPGGVPDAEDPSPQVTWWALRKTTICFGRT